MADVLMVTLSCPAEAYIRADLEFHGVDHSKASFEGRLFINNATAGPDTTTDDANGYAGSFWIFGHGGCAGAEGHCEPPRERRAFDFRPPHQLIPVSKRVIVTERLRALVAPGADFTVRIVPVVRPEHAASLPGGLVTDLLQVERVDLLTYQ
jgi:tyrosinase